MFICLIWSHWNIGKSASTVERTRFFIVFFTFIIRLHGYKNTQLLYDAHTDWLHSN